MSSVQPGLGDGINVRGRSPRRWTVAFGAALALFVALATGTLIYRQYERTLVDAKRELRNLTTVLSEEADRSFQSLDLVQRSVAERISGLGITSSEQLRQRLSRAEVHQLLKEKIAGLPFITVLSLVDANGDLVNFSQHWPAPRFSLEDRDYFEAFRSNPATTTFLSKPMQSRATRDWAIATARKLEGPDGQFIGLVLAEVELAYFEKFFQRISLGDASSVALFRRDGILLARHPRAEPSIGRSFASQATFQELRSGERSTVRQVSAADGKDRMVSARALAHYPVVVAVTNTVEAITADWREDAIYFSLLALCGELLIACGVVLALRQVRSAELLARARAAELQAANEHALAKSQLLIAEERARSAAALEEQYETVRRHEQELEVQNLRFNAALTNMSQGLVMFDSDHKLVVWNQRYSDVYGMPPELLKPGTTQREILEYRVRHGAYGVGDPEAYIQKRIENATRGEAADDVIELSNGRIVAVSHRPMPDGGWVATHEDITERRRAEAQIAHLAKHDALTDLPNRVLFRERLAEALGRAARGEAAAVLCLDLDHFKNVNDTLGHPVGDLLLQTVAERLRACVRETDTVARLSGDEFAVLQVASEQPQGAGALGRRILDSLAAPYELDGHHVVIGSSVGIALSPSDGIDPDQLLKSADLALYRAKWEGRGRYRFFEPDMDARMQARRLLELDLRRALTAGEFQLHFQPLMQLDNNEISGFEALLRWPHPTRGMVPPSEFIPLAEEIGLIMPIGEWVLREACTEAASWPRELKVAVNISPAQFKNQTLVSTVVSALASSGLAPSRLELEITESVLLQDDEGNLRTLHKLRELGVRISLDDFGTGYSSLSYLRKFPFDKIKIDQSFVRELSSRSDSAAIVRAVASLGSTLGMATTAEGVETHEQLERLRSEGCTEAQGYLFSRPKPAAELPALFSAEIFAAVA